MEALKPRMMNSPRKSAIMTGRIMARGVLVCDECVSSATCAAVSYLQPMQLRQDGQAGP